jgi:hypothetical protein
MTSPGLHAQIPQFESLEPRLLLTGDQIQVDYLIIAGDEFFPGGNPCEAIRELAAWKQLKGFRTLVSSASHAESVDLGIGNYIYHGCYEENGEWWQKPPEYVLLVGDANQVPASTSICTTDPEVNHVTDAPYANTWQESSEWPPGDTHVPEIAIGRIPVDNVQDATIVIDKILKYDRDPDVPGIGQADWYKNALVASYFEDGAVPLIEGSSDGNEDMFYFMDTAHRVADFLGGDYDYWPDTEESADPFNKGYNVQTALIATAPDLTEYSYYGGNYGGDPPPRDSNDLPPETISTKWTDLWRSSTDGSGGVKEAIETAWTGGLGMVLYRDHGAIDGWKFGEEGALFGADDLPTELDAGLLGENPTPVVFNMGCLTGKFDSSDCFATALLKNPLGAVGVLGATDETIPGYTDWLTQGLYTGLWRDFDPEQWIWYSVQADWSFGPPVRPAESLAFADGYLFAKAYGNANAEWELAKQTIDDFEWFGDPEMMLRTEAPAQLRVTYPSTILGFEDAGPGRGAGLRVYVEKLVGDQWIPLEDDANVQVCLSKAGTSDFFVSQGTGGAGQISVIADCTSFDTAPSDYHDIVITGQNLVPWHGTIKVGTKIAAATSSDNIWVSLYPGKHLWLWINGSEYTVLDNRPGPWAVPEIDGMGGGDSWGFSFVAEQPESAEELTFNIGDATSLRFNGSEYNEVLTIRDGQAVFQGAIGTCTVNYAGVQQITP